MRVSDIDRTLGAALGHVFSYLHPSTTWPATVVVAKAKRVCKSPDDCSVTRNHVAHPSRAVSLCRTPHSLSTGGPEATGALNGIRWNGSQRDAVITTRVAGCSNALQSPLTSHEQGPAQGCTGPNEALNDPGAGVRVRVEEKAGKGSGVGGGSVSRGMGVVDFPWMEPQQAGALANP
ncbi:unnamed protein product [Gadus morhua 'NCC']